MVGLNFLFFNFYMFIEQRFQACSMDESLAARLASSLLHTNKYCNKSSIKIYKYEGVTPEKKSGQANDVEYGCKEGPPKISF